MVAHKAESHQGGLLFSVHKLRRKGFGPQYGEILLPSRATRICLIRKPRQLFLDKFDTAVD